MNELELRYGDCTVKRLSGGTLSAAMKNLLKFNYAGTRLGQIRITGLFGCPVGDIEMDPSTKQWQFTPENEDPYLWRESAAKLMGDIREHISQTQGVES